MKDLVHVLLELARNGQQIILATHDYVLLKWFDLLMDKGKEIRSPSIACTAILSMVILSEKVSRTTPLLLEALSAALSQSCTMKTLSVHWGATNADLPCRGKR